MAKTALFFSRGRGYGHAIPDMAISQALATDRPDINIVFVSYASGATVFRAHGLPVVDLDLPEQNLYLETLIKCVDCIRAKQPDLVVVHEEFAALVAAKLLGVKSIFVSAWLPMATGIWLESLRYATGIVVLGHPGIFPISEGIRTLHVGPIIRRMAVTVNDRKTLREPDGIPESTFVVVIIPGGADRVENRATFELVCDALQQVRGPERRLVWVGDDDFDAERAKPPYIVQRLPFQTDIERILAPADVVITKGTRGTTYDAAAVGIRSISLSPNKNPYDDILVPRIPGNLALNRQAVTPSILAHYLVQLWNQRGSKRVPLAPTDAVRRAASLIASMFPENGIVGA